ncbi:MAG: Asp23/Gls24 family envelope stress response protein [Clostridia bacterium]|jgi:uncharacterized alkaline shock family protein YloU|nr:Asp23/Gls24 family envelope stress response protein [Clostridia bacterium]MDD3094006.1 Asp23/Gls24 family envelope stress response protein [Clostridia bacterium]MDD3972135.1 Asp23/Gls24 family envelope stress response protein [Clostridia bacterium]MDD4543420.1 Asp23/Gls24 family envelope stress response protein [Clostridia bacterium]NLF36223.1 Asp23/Gls24 family envelope stress response protein [Clostridiaceae bacterium]
MINNSGTDVAESIIVVKIAQTVGLFSTVRLTKKKRPIKITDSEKRKTVEIFVDINYNIVIPQVTADIQRAIAKVLDKELDIVLDSIDITVEGVNIDKLENK